MHLYGGTSRGNTLGRGQMEYMRGQIEKNDDTISQVILAGDFNSDAAFELQNQVDGPCTFLLKPLNNSSYNYTTVPHDGINPKIVTTNRSDRHLDWVFVGIKNPQNDPCNAMTANLEKASVGAQIINASDHRLHAVEIKGTKQSYGKFETFCKIITKLFKSIFETFAEIFIAHSIKDHHGSRKRSYHYSERSHRQRTHPRDDPSWQKDDDDVLPRGMGDLEDNWAGL